MKPAHRFSLCPGGCQGINNNNHHMMEIEERTMEKEKTVKKHNKTRNPSITQRKPVKHDEMNKDTSTNKNSRKNDNRSEFGPFFGNDCCNCLCNKRGLFTEIDMAFSNFMQLVPNSNTACRCCNKLYTAPIFQGRSCACLIRPRQRPYGGCSNGSSGGRGCSPERCGCYNHIYEDIYL